MDSSSLTRDAKVNWHYTPPGGYGHTMIVAGLVLGWTEKRVQIMVAQKVGDRWDLVKKQVKLENLTLRTSVCAELGET